MEILGSVWGNLRENSVDTGLYILQHFFTVFPEEVVKFQFNMDDHGNIRPNFLTSKSVREHSMKIMNALDAGKNSALAYC